MKCRNHPDQDAVALCQKIGTGFCAACCDCEETTVCCGCLDPQVYCQFRPQCLIWELSRARRRTP
jgi:hypothetical protein